MAPERAKRRMLSWGRLGWTEKVVYRPAKAGLLPREIDAIVDRMGNDPVMHGQAPAFRITALNDELMGIPSDPKLSDAGGDRIDVAERFGGPRATRSLQRFIEQDGDLVTVEVL